MLNELRYQGSFKTSGASGWKPGQKVQLAIAVRFETEQWRKRINQPTAIMSKDTSELAKELEQMLSRNVLTTQANVARIGIKIENPDASIRQPIRIQQPMIRRQQYYTGDA